MAKAKSVFVCVDCGSSHAKWQGQCADCGAWNTLKEIKRSKPSDSPSRDAKFEGYTGHHSCVKVLNEIDLDDLPRVKTGIGELDLVLGSGLVPGSIILLGGNPGTGKSTLILQACCLLANSMDVLYSSGEESLQQIAMRAKRLELPTDKLRLVSETNVESICVAAKNNTAKVLVVDSIQSTFHPDIPSAPGGVSQVRECAAYLTRYAKQTGTIVLVIGHVTKDSSLSGPKILEHILDGVFLLDGTDDSRFRTLRATKNRFGAINEIGIFAMMETGMKEVKNPSAIFLSRASEPAPGSIVMVIWEGTRPLLIELQALVDDSSLGNPRRVTVGLDHNRINMLLAVLHRHGGVSLGGDDVFVNVVGGVKVLETSADLALLLAVLSSYKNQIIPENVIAFGEVGLSGEVRPVSSGPERLSEAFKHGFKKAIVPKANVPKDGIKGMEIIGVDKLTEALEAVL